MKYIKFFTLAVIFGSLVFVSCSSSDDEGGECLVSDNGVFVLKTIEKLPKYNNGGEEGFSRDVLENVLYPELARANGVEGNCVVQYEISQLGQLQNFVILEDPGSGIGEASIAALSALGGGILFSPAVDEGISVRSRKELSIVFKLEG